MLEFTPVVDFSELYAAIKLASTSAASLIDSVLIEALDQFVANMEDIVDDGEVDTRESRQLEIARRLLEELNTQRASSADRS